MHPSNMTNKELIKVNSDDVLVIELQKRLALIREVNMQALNHQLECVMEAATDAVCELNQARGL